MAIKRDVLGISRLILLVDISDEVIPDFTNVVRYAVLAHIISPIGCARLLGQSRFEMFGQLVKVDPFVRVGGCRRRLRRTPRFMQGRVPLPQVAGYRARFCAQKARLTSWDGVGKAF